MSYIKELRNIVAVSRGEGFGPRAPLLDLIKVIKKQWKYLNFQNLVNDRRGGLYFL